MSGETVEQATREQAVREPGIILATREEHAVLPKDSAVAIDLDEALTVPVGS